MQKEKVFLVSSLHFLLDSYMGFFAIYIVIAKLDPMKAALIASISAFVGNVLQPFMGYAADRVRGKFPLFLGLILTPLSMSMLGITDKYVPLFFLVFFGHIGSSFFHPAGANIASAAGIARKDRSMSVFSTIGTIGYALSQPLFSAFTGAFGTSRSWLLMFHTIVLALVLFSLSKTRIHGPERVMRLKDMGAILRQRLVPLLLLFFIMVFRMSFIVALDTFLAKTFEEWGFPRSIYSIASPVFMLSGAGGILLSGHIAHRIRPWKLLFFSLTSFFPFFLGFLTAGRAGNLTLAFIFLGLCGFFIQGSYVSNIVMGHRVAPEMTSTISGILMGFAWASASFGPVLCAFSRDALWFSGLASGLLVLSFFPLIAAFGAIALSKFTGN